MNKKARIQQYLERYVLADSRAAAELVANHRALPFKRVLCVPMFDEDMRFLDALKTHPAIAGTLIVLVVNAPDSADQPAIVRTRHLRDALKSADSLSSTTNTAWTFDVKVSGGVFSVLVMDHCSKGRCLPRKEGVGLARKLGNDVGLELWHRKLVESPWLYQTDADATLPVNYFHMPLELSDCAGVHLNFEHRHGDSLSSETSLAQRLYDLKLDYYVAGLTHAESPYAHYSVGSCIVIRADYYAIVRGYPRHSAGEDFYVLNKLAKEGRVAFDPSRAVWLTERESNRVPFGTGPGVARFKALENPLAEAAFYAPSCFMALRDWLRFLKHSVESASGHPHFESRHALTDFVDATDRLPVLIVALQDLGLLDWLRRTLSENENPIQAARQIRIGMDALKTLRLIHALRDHGFANVDARVALEWLNAQPARTVHLRRNIDRSLTDV